MTLYPESPDPSNTVKDFSVDWNQHWANPAKSRQFVADPCRISFSAASHSAASPSGRLF